MTEKETAKVLTLLREAFPQGKEITGDTVKVWSEIFEQEQFDVVWEAAGQIVRTWEGFVMPPPAVLFKQIRKMDPHEDTAIELWRAAEKAIKRGTVITQEEFDELPTVVRMYFGGTSAIRDMALLDVSEIPNERARFLRQAPDLIARADAQAMLPDAVKEMLEQKVKQIEGDQI